MQDEVADNPTRPWDEAIANLDSILSLGNLEREDERRVWRLLVYYPKKFIGIVAKFPVAGSADKQQVIFEPTELFWRLVAAVSANSHDDLTVIDHDIRS